MVQVSRSEVARNGSRQLKDLSAFHHGVVRAGDSVPNGARAAEDLEIVATLVGLISKEVHGLELLKKLQAVCLVPSLGEHIKADLATNGIGEAVVCEALPQRLHKLLAHASGQVILLKLITLLLTAVAPNRRHIQHAIPELHKGATLDRNVQVSHVMENIIDEGFELVISQMHLEALHSQQLSSLVCHEPVLSKYIVVIVD
mmetsp:Transcript_19058/g.32643  ORF Transcript_19058/g.32643 Transcript_19058/m.32643 type:complete len:201 (-) Transcript_19058:338-940(-)